MKKCRKWISVLLVMVLCLGMVFTVSAAGENTKPVLVPLAFICESQGAKVEYTAGIVKVTKGNKTFSVKPGTGEVAIQGKRTVMKSSVEVDEGRLRLSVDLINRGLGTKLTLSDCEKILAVKYMDLLKQNAYSDCKALFDAPLKQDVPPVVVQQMGLSLLSCGEIKQLSIKTSSNAVHDNVSIRCQSKAAGTFDFIVRFDKQGHIDDCMVKTVDLEVPYKAPAYDQPKNYIEKEVSFGTGDLKLPGTLTIPRGKGPFPVVVLVHGSGANDRDETVGGQKLFRDLAVGLASKNVAVLRFEKISLEHNLKERLIPKSTVKDEYLDPVRNAVDYLSTVKEVDPTKIFLLGHSEGAYLMPRMLAGDKDNRIRGGIMMSGCSRPMYEVLPEQYQYLGSLQAASATPEQLEQIKQQVAAVQHQVDLINDPSFSPDNPPKDFTLGIPWYWADLKAYNPVETAKTVKVPMLILQGARDFQVLAKKDFQDFKDGLSGSSNVSFKLYDKLNHMYTEGQGEMSTPMEYYNPANAPQYVIDDISQWILNQAK